MTRTVLAGSTNLAPDTSGYLCRRENHYTGDVVPRVTEKAMHEKTIALQPLGPSGPLARTADNLFSSGPRADSIRKRYYSMSDLASSDSRVFINLPGTHTTNTR